MGGARTLGRHPILSFAVRAGMIACIQPISAPHISFVSHSYLPVHHGALARLGVAVVGAHRIHLHFDS